MADYEVTRTVGQCASTGRTFGEGESFYSALFETTEGFERRDYSEQSWDGPPEGAFCHFKTKLPTKEKARKTFVDDDVLINFFQRLEKSEENSKLRFRFVLSLILMRKRLLKYVGTVKEADQEFWQMRLMRDKSTHKVLNPVLSEMEIESLTGEVGMILHGGPSDTFNVGADQDTETDTEADTKVDTEADAKPSPEPSPEPNTGATIEPNTESSTESDVPNGVDGVLRDASCEAIVKPSDEGEQG